MNVLCINYRTACCNVSLSTEQAVYAANVEQSLRDLNYHHSLFVFVLFKSSRSVLKNRKSVLSLIV